VHTGDCERIYGKMTQEQVIKALKKGQEQHGPQIPEKGYLDLVETYFHDVSQRESYHESEQIFKAMEELRYEKNLQKPGVGNFEVIKEQHQTVTVFIEYDEAATQGLQAYEQLLQGQLSRELFNLHHKRHFQQRIVAVSAFLPKSHTLKQEAAAQLAKGLWVVRRPNLHKYYTLPTGFSRAQENTTTDCLML